MLRDFPVEQTVVKVPGSRGLDPAEAAAVPIRNAATVMLVRHADGEDDGLEVFTFRRRPSLVFAAGMRVFPGGAVEPADADASIAWQGPDPGHLAGLLGAPPDLARAIVVAAVRETFEECGVLLAGPAGGPPFSEPTRGPDWERARLDLAAGSATAAGVLGDRGWAVHADLLLPWAHWVTPAGERRRFDTRFFVALLPAGQEAMDLGGEGESAAWIRPADALAEHARREVPMLPPTVVAMEELAAAGSVAALVAAAGRRRPRPVSPWLVRVGSADGSAGWVVRVDLDGIGGGEPGPGRSR